MNFPSYRLLFETPPARCTASRLETSSYGAYLGSGEFWEATFENWESEFLQMAAFLLLSSFLIQRGSSQSKKPEEEEEAEEAAHPITPRSPWPVRVGGPALALPRLHRRRRDLAVLLHALG